MFHGRWVAGARCGLARARSACGETLAAAHALQALLAARDAAAWLGGNCDVAGHLRAGGHLQVECPGAQGARLQALRGLLALAGEMGARLLSAGVQWLVDDSAKLVGLGALCCERAWEAATLSVGAGQLAIVAVRSGAGTAAQIAAIHDDLSFAEFVVTLPVGDAIVHQQGYWWRLGP